MNKTYPILTFILFIIVFSSFGQRSKNKIFYKAFDFYLEKKCDSALLLFEQIISHKKYANDARVDWCMGNCYANLSQFEKAKNYYLLGIKDTVVDPFFSSQRNCCHALAELYMQKGEYEKALDYFRLAEQKFPFKYIVIPGKWEDKLELKYKFAQCFVAINQIDSAIAHLTPYIFDEVSTDSINNAKIFEYYKTLLAKRYTKEEITAQLISLKDNVYYKKTMLTEYSNDFNMYEVECYLFFLGYRVVITNVIYDANSIQWGEEYDKEYDKEYTKENIMKIFFNSPGYKRMKEY